MQQIMNMERDKNHFDFVIVGSGFAGSITAMCLKQLGYRVCMIEKDKHPRFSVGESSTPIADMILRDLSRKYDLPFFMHLSRYGTWQTEHPEIICGLKRGFSYYPHEIGNTFSSNDDHLNELLVAASFDDDNSDTNWLRSDVDQFLAGKACEIGVLFYEEAEVVRVHRTEASVWEIAIKKDQKQMLIHSVWIIDATGSPHFSGKFFGTTSSADGFETNSTAIFTHFNEAGYWFEYLTSRGFNTKDYPYNPDHSALHHLIKEGWIWMLRFNNGLLSAGLLMENSDSSNGIDAEKIWHSVINQYPSLSKIFRYSKPAEIPGKFINSGRLQRKLNRSFGDGWIALNHTVGFVDPLHSTGIAHTLAGVEKIVNLFGKAGLNKIEISDIKIIQEESSKELKFIDKLVSMSYQSRHDFALFSASVMLYFIASIRYEQSRLKGDIPNTFLCADHEDLSAIIEETHHELKMLDSETAGQEQIHKQIEKIRGRIEPYNSVGLMDPSKKNMYRHTAVNLIN